MSNFEKYEYWLELCDDDLDTAKWLLQGGKLLYCGYLSHLVVEKALKAAIAKNTKEIPPKIHDLQKLAKQGGLLDKLSKQQAKLIDDLMPMQIEARYPEYKERIAQTLTKKACERFVKEAEELLCWIKQQLEK